MEHAYILSIVVPCFNRHDLLIACLNSSRTRAASEVEVLVVDDGSDPPLEPYVRSAGCPVSRVLSQSNRGRSAALRNGLLAATGEFVLIMDSDDEFLPGAVDRIVADIRSLPAALVGIVYDTVDFETGRPIGGLPDKREVTLLELRADLKIRGDLKEVVRTSVVKEALYPDPESERRVPTSYIWAGVSGYGDVLTASYPVVRHRYLPGGMTNNIRLLKHQNPYWLSRTYLRIVNAGPKVYLSRWFRFTYAVRFYGVAGVRPTKDDQMLIARRIGYLPRTVAMILGRAIRVVR